MKKILIIAMTLITFSNCTKKNEVNLKMQFLVSNDYTYTINDDIEKKGNELTNNTKEIVWDLNKKIKVHIKGLDPNYNEIRIYFIYQNKIYSISNLDPNTKKPIGDILDFNGKLY